MKKYEIFFSENGITSTSANHIANIAKEYVARTENTLNNIAFVNKSVTLVGTQETHELAKGATYEDLQSIESYLNAIADAKSLIAWLREAIKAREEWLNDIDEIDLYKYCTQNNIVLPKSPTIPSNREIVSENDVIATFSVKDRNRMYTLNTQSAVIGKFIHPDGRFSDAREDLNDKILNPCDISGSGRDAMIYKYTPSVDSQSVEDLFFNLQARHREIESELNSYKHKIKLAIERDEIDENCDYEKASGEYKAEYEIYNSEMSSIRAKFRDYKRRESTRVGNLKIIIPNDLLDIYNVISKLGK